MDAADSARLREMLAERPALKVRETRSRLWIFGDTTFTITGEQATVSLSQKDVQEAQLQWRLDRAW